MSWTSLNPIAGGTVSDQWQGMKPIDQTAPPDPPTPPDPDEPVVMMPAGSGKVTSFSGAGVSVNFETTKDQIQAEQELIKLQSMQRGIVCTPGLPCQHFTNRCRKHG